MANVEPSSATWWHSADDVDVWTDLRVPASSINPAGQTGAAAIDTGETDFPGSILFVHTGKTMIAGVVQLDHDTKVGAGCVLKPHIHWAKTTSAAGEVVWEFLYRLIGNVGDVAGDWSTADNGTLAISHADTADSHAITAFSSIDLTNARASSMYAFRLYRAPAETGDNYDATVRLYELDFHYQRAASRRGTLLEYPSVT